MDISYWKHDLLGMTNYKNIKWVDYMNHTWLDSSIGNVFYSVNGDHLFKISIFSLINVTPSVPFYLSFKVFL